MEHLSGVRILVTGASGFLGSHVVPSLQAQGAVVYPVSRANYDIRNEAEVLMATLLSRPDVIVHLAAPSPTLSQAIRFRETLQMGLNVAHAAAATGARLIFALPDAIYPMGKEPALEEEFQDATDGKLQDSRIRASRAVAWLIEEYRASSGLNALGVVLPILYGPGDQRSVLAQSAYSLRVRKDEKSIGLQKASFRLLHASDASSAISGVCTKRDVEGLLNLPGALVEATDWTRHLLRGFGLQPGKPKIEWLKAEKSALPGQREMSGVKAAKLLPQDAQVDPETGLAQFAAWLDEKCFGMRPQPSLEGRGA